MSNAACPPRQPALNHDVASCAVTAGSSRTCASADEPSLRRNAGSLSSSTMTWTVALPFLAGRTSNACDSSTERITTNCYLSSVLRKVAASAPRLLASEMRRIVFLGQLDGGEYEKTILHPWMFSAVAQEQPLRCRHSAQPPYRTVSMSMHSTPWVEDSFFFI